jgi:glutamate dehydrogenase (NADP+)
MCTAQLKLDTVLSSPICATFLQSLWEEVQRRDPHESEFQQAVEEVLNTMSPVLAKDPKYLPIIKRLVEPERVIMFRVPWVDDAGRVQVRDLPVHQ